MILPACPSNATYQPRRVRRAVGCMRWLAKQAIVVGVAADPEPHESVWHLHRQSAVVSPDPSGPEPADLLEVKRGMAGILLQSHVRLIGEIPGLRGQGSV